MSDLKFVKAEKILLSNHQSYNERWVQKHIAADPSLIGLGDDLFLKDEERHQPHKGRLDLLLQDSQNLRYEVEIQLGKVDESHIIRTIEYWDIERKRYPQYDHCAVIIAEDITSRFLNVIQLFNGFIPIIAIQMTALSIDNYVTLEFTKVLDQMTLGLVEEDESVREVVDRNYWEKTRGTSKTIGMVDKMLEWVKEFDNACDLKYNKHYVGIARDGMPYNFVHFKPLKNFTWIHVHCEESEDFNNALDQSGLDYKYAKRWRNYDVRLITGDVVSNEDLIKSMLKTAYDYRN